MAALGRELPGARRAQCRIREVVEGGERQCRRAIDHGPVRGRGDRGGGESRGVQGVSADAMAISGWIAGIRTLTFPRSAGGDDHHSHTGPVRGADPLGRFMIRRHEGCR